jgi:hypothetical protein
MTGPKNGEQVIGVQDSRNECEHIVVSSQIVYRIACLSRWLCSAEGVTCLENLSGSPWCCWCS